MPGWLNHAGDVRRHLVQQVEDIATPSRMTNGTVSTVSTPTTVNSTMTNGTVSSTTGSGGAKQIVVTYKGGNQVILVPPTAPIVTYQLGEGAELKPGAAVFINALSHGGTDARIGVARLVLLVTRRDRPLQLAASMLTIDTSEVCNPPRGTVGYSVLCAAWRFFIISNHSIEPGWGTVGTGLGLLRSAAASASWR